MDEKDIKKDSGLRETENLEDELKKEVEFEQNQNRRWYDDDYELHKIVESMRYSDDTIRIRIAMIIIKNVVEMNVVTERYENIDNLMYDIRTGLNDPRRLRWYDIDSTVRTAMSMLKKCPVTSYYEISHNIKSDFTKLSMFIL